MGSEPDALIEARVERGILAYSGDAQIDGVPGTSAPIQLAFLERFTD
ncbi:MAG: hypothetical protein J0H42_27310 [Rhizobiales bacterium]|nr:hypothetical protein [Hyphomicrobiales bacterium]